MSGIYIVSYDFRGSPEHFPELVEALTSFPSWWHYMDGTWLIVAEEGDNEHTVYEKLDPYVDGGVNLMVSRLGDTVLGQLPKEAWKWIDEQRSTAPKPSANGVHPAAIPETAAV